MIRTLAAALATTTCIVALAAPAAAQTREYNIPAGSLKSALDTYVRQSGRQIVYRADQVRSARSPGTSGQQSAEAALAAILAGTGFSTRIDGNLVAIVREGNGQTAAESPSSEDVSEEIVVTGSQIRGAPPVSSRVTFSAEDIEASGYSTIQEFTESIPQNFGGGAEGASQDGITGTGPYRTLNNTAATSINLRGLGAGATLTLVNGHRIAPTLFGRATDISQFPLAAIERIEVVSDGASAVYGSDAIAGVVNIILKRDYEGAESFVGYRTVTEGDRSDFTAAQSIGAKWSSGSIVANAQYQKQTPLSSSDRSFASLLPVPYDLLPASEGYSLSASARQDVSPEFSLFADALFSQREGSRRLTAASETLRQTTYDVNSLSIAGGGLATFARGWQLEVVGNFSQEQYYSEQLRLARTGTRSLFDTDNTSKSWSIEAIVRGQITSSPRSPKVAFGASLRGESFDQVVKGPPASSQHLDRNIAAGFLEIAQPLIIASDGVHWSRSSAS